MRRESIPYGKSSSRKAGIDVNPTRCVQGVTIRDGSQIDLYRVQSIQDNVLYGKCVAKRGDKELGACIYSFPKDGNARLHNIEVELSERGKGIGSALLNFFTIDVLVWQRRTRVLATSDVNSIYKFMEKNGYKVIPMLNEKEIHYSIYTSDKERMATILEQQKDPARVGEYLESRTY